MPAAMGPGDPPAPGWVRSNARNLRSLYFAGFGLAYLVTWIAPSLLGPRVLRTLVFYVILESIAILTSFALVMPWVDSDDADDDSAWVSLVWVPLGTAFAVWTAFEFGIPWGVAPFVLSLASMGGDLVGADRGGPAVQPVKYRLVATFVVFMGAAALTMILPTPELGITDAVVAQQGFGSLGISSDFFDEPELAMAWGGLYFLGLAAAERLDLKRWLAENDASG